MVLNLVSASSGKWFTKVSLTPPIAKNGPQIISCSGPYSNT